MLQKGLRYGLPVFLILLFRAGGGRSLLAQTCSGWQLQVQVFASGHHDPVPFAVFSVPELRRLFRTDSSGQAAVCLPELRVYRFLFRNLGYDSISLEAAPGRRRLVVHLRESQRTLEPVGVSGQARVAESAVTRAEVMGKTELLRGQGQSLGELAARIPGVGAIQTGPTLFKPVLQGMAGQRVAVFQNGVRLEGQQWGFDHAPETDAGMADRLVVLKGAQSVRLGSDALGGGILLEHSDPDPSGKTGVVVSTGYHSNSRGFTGRVQAEKSWGKTDRFSARVVAGGRNFGPARTPAFILGNTALRESALLFLMQHRRGAWQNEFVVSGFRTGVGIFTGSHVGSQEGVRRVFSRPDSSFNYPFSRRIDRPSQLVNHQLVKLRSVYAPRPSGRTEFQYSFQRDLREEFDLIRRSGVCPGCPQLRLTLFTHMLEVNRVRSRESSELRMGAAGQFQFSDTRFRIFIPDFSLGQVAAYAVGTLYRGRQVWEAGIRSESRWLQVFPPAGSGRGSGRRLFFSFMANGGFRRTIHEHWTLSANAMAAMRPPHVSELYSSGVHHGSASYEQGDASLKPETVLNLSSSLHHRSAHWEVVANGYLTRSPGFIYLSPLGDSVLLTIRGAFPFFQYRQSEVTLRGADVFIRYEPFPFLGVEVRAQALRGWNHSERDYLIFQPADRLSACIRLQKNLSSRGIAFDFRFGPVRVARQTRYPADRDFIAPPAGFTLWEGQAAVSRRQGPFPFDLSVEVRNLFNLRYREYLNRFRYFAPEAGRNLMIRISIPIHS